MRTRPQRPDEYAHFIADHLHEWDDPLPEPVDLLIKTLCSLLIRQVREVLSETQANTLPIDEKEARRFKELSPQRREEQEAKAKADENARRDEEARRASRRQPRGLWPV